MKAKNTPRERILNALHHLESDRVPIDFGSTFNTGITIDAYERLKKHLKIELPTKVISLPYSLAQVDEPVLERLNVDTRGVWTVGSDVWEDKHLSSNRFIDEWGVRYFKAPSSLYYDIEDGPFYNEFTMKNLKDYPWPDAHNKGRIRGIKERVKALRANTDYAIVLHVVGGFITQSQDMRGLEKWLADILLQPELLGELLDRTLKFQMDLTIDALEAADGDVDVIHFGDDLGMQNGLMFSPKTYRNVIKPRQAKLFGLAKKNSKAKILFHSCGSNYEIMEDLIEIGVDAFNPVQTNAKNMDAAKLKSEFGDRITFWGGIDTQSILSFGSVDDVKVEVKRKIDLLSPSGGFVLNSVHNIQPDVPPENICAMFDTAIVY